MDINQIYNGSVWGGLVDPSQNNVYLITNNKWNWFVYRASSSRRPSSPPSSSSSAPTRWPTTTSMARGSPTIRPAFIQPETFANDAGIGTVRGNTTSSYTARHAQPEWQHHQWRTGLTWAAPWKLRVSNTFTMQSGMPSGPITTNLAASDPQYGPATLVIGGRTVSNPLATTCASSTPSAATASCGRRG